MTSVTKGKLIALIAACILIWCLYWTRGYHLKWLIKSGLLTKSQHPASNFTDYCDDKSKGDNSKPKLLLGILSKNDHNELRDVHRKYLLSGRTLPFNVVICFLLDQLTPTVEHEARKNRDIVILNTTSAGWGRGFGEKLFIWYDFVYTKFPSSLLVGKMDDDTFLCVSGIFDRLYKVAHTRLYYGWLHGFVGNARQNPEQRAKSENGFGRIRQRHDEMFVVLGRDLLHRIAERKFCFGKQKTACDLVDTGFGGTSLGRWLTNYSDVKQVSDNGQLIHYDRTVKFLKPNFCSEFLLLHPIKSLKSITDMYHWARL